PNCASAALAGSPASGAPGSRVASVEGSKTMTCGEIAGNCRTGGAREHSERGDRVLSSGRSCTENLVRTACEGKRNALRRWSAADHARPRRPTVAIAPTVLLFHAKNLYPRPSVDAPS